MGAQGATLRTRAIAKGYYYPHFTGRKLKLGGGGEGRRSNLLQDTLLGGGRDPQLSGSEAWLSLHRVQGHPHSLFLWYPGRLSGLQLCTEGWGLKYGAHRSWWSWREGELRTLKVGLGFRQMSESAEWEPKLPILHSQVQRPPPAEAFPTSLYSHCPSSEPRLAHWLHHRPLADHRLLENRALLSVLPKMLLAWERHRSPSWGGRRDK